MKRNRITYYLIYAFIVLVTLSVLSTVYNYFHTGAMKTNKYDVGINLLSEHNPKVTWLPDDKDIRGAINPYLRKEIEASYIDAWGILNLSIKHQEDLGLAENFTDSKVELLSKQFNAKDSIKRNDLSHNLKLHFISLDKQVVSFTDFGATLRWTMKSMTHTITRTDTSDYKVLMTLNDGKWRVNKMLRVK